MGYWTMIIHGASEAEANVAEHLNDVVSLLEAAGHRVVNAQTAPDTIAVLPAPPESADAAPVNETPVEEPVAPEPAPEPAPVEEPAPAPEAPAETPA